VWINPKDQARIGAQLEAARKKAGLTQVELAKRLRKPQSFVSSYESGQRRLDLLELTRIAATLAVDPRALLNEILDGIVPRTQAAKSRKRTRP
jgi:transcriptional regulator with XRE-family HTH domain